MQVNIFLNNLMVGQTKSKQR